MFITAHIAYPTLIFMLIANLFNINYSSTHILILIFFSILPDLDNLVYGIITRSKKNLYGPHRKWFTHWPITYTPFLVLLCFKPSLVLALICFGIYFHFFLDTFLSEDGMMWLAPFSKKFFIFSKINLKERGGNFWFREYRKKLIFKVEVFSFVFLIIALLKIF
ncbi:MAG: metal-dependent hydrolase [Candidatus Woesearchaeota archaeon]